MSMAEVRQDRPCSAKDHDWLLWFRAALQRFQGEELLELCTNAFLTLHWISAETLDESDPSHRAASSIQSAWPTRLPTKWEITPTTISVIPLAEDPLLLNLKEGMINIIKWVPSVMNYNCSSNWCAAWTPILSLQGIKKLSTRIRDENSLMLYILPFSL